MLLANHFPSHISCHHLALAAQDGVAQLHVFGEGEGINSLFSREGIEKKSKATEVVETQTLDHFCSQHDISYIDFLKLDVEGAELEVLKGGVQMLSQKAIKKIQFEYGGCNIDSRTLLKDLFSFLTPFGYRIYKIMSRKLQPCEGYDQNLENFQTSNYLAILEE